MPYDFADSFDLYAAAADAGNGYWDSYTVGSGPSLVAGRFTGGRAWSVGTNFNLIKNSGQNDAVHHIVVAFQTTSNISGTNLGAYFTFGDGATAQCTIVFRQDGVILLASGGPAGTILATYPNAFSIQAAWYAYEFEVVISNTVGAFRVRRNGNNVNDFDSGATLNTRGGTANNYANRMTFGCSTGYISQLDDLYWRSSAAAGSWLGDLRCLVRTPFSDVSTQFTRSASSMNTTVGTFVTTSGGGYSIYSVFTAPINGPLVSATWYMNANFTGNVKTALFSTNASNNPGTVLATANIVTNPILGANTTTFPTPPTLVKGVQYFLGTMPDTSGATFQASSVSGRYTNSTTNPTYAAFPAANPPIASNSNNVFFSYVVTAVDNASFVAETPHDSTTTYVYDSTPGDADFYGLAALTTTGSTIAAVTRSYMEKSDAGTRTSAVRLRSGATTVSGATVVLINTGWQWSWRMDVNDPNTGSLWTAANLNNVNIGPIVIA